MARKCCTCIQDLHFFQLRLAQSRVGPTTQPLCPFQRYRHHVLLPEVLPSGCSGSGVFTVPETSALHTFCRALCTTGGSWRDRAAGVANFRLVSVQAIVHDDEVVTMYTANQNKMSRLRQHGGDYFNFATHTFTAEQLHVLSLLRDQFQERAPGPNNSRGVNTLYCYHGPKREHIASICANGMVATRATDAGFFGCGCYSTLNIEYAVRYAHGDFDAEGTRPSPDGRYPVIMFAATVGMVYPVTPGTDYGNVVGIPPRHSDYFGRPLKEGFDCHMACVSQASGFQAVNREQCDYVELVIEQQVQMLPLAVLWFEEN